MKKTQKRFKSFKTCTQQLAVKDAIQEDQLNEETKNKTETIKEIEKIVNREGLLCETVQYNI